MANSTNFERLDLTPEQWRGLLRLQGKLRSFTPSRILITKLPSERVYTVTFFGPRSMPKQIRYLLYPNGDTEKSVVSD